MSSGPLSERKHILVVEDDPDLCELLAEVLVDEGYSVNRAGDGAEALQALDATSTNAVLLDLHMPGMNGDEFLARRAADPRLAKIPVIVMSGSAQRPTAIFRTFILDKPIEIAALVAALDRCFATVTSDHDAVTRTPDGNITCVGL